VENAFARLRQYRAVATRYDKLKRNFENILTTFERSADPKNYVLMAK
jgi:hypothetical protein